jgi:hypothetical protein
VIVGDSPWVMGGLWVMGDGTFSPPARHQLSNDTKIIEIGFNRKELYGCSKD